MAPLILDAASSLEPIYGDRDAALRAIEATYRADRTELSHRFGLVAEDEGVQGIAIAFPGRLFGSLKLGTGVVLARVAGARHLPDLVRRGRILDRLMPAPPGDALYVSVLSVSAEQRRRGVATALLERAVAGAERLGMGVCLDVGLENEGAIALYERLGFRQVSVRETTEIERRLIPTPGSARLERR
ncbi:MAG: GNAT family N-acetyltransferase [Actinomycetota bacterium]